MGFYTLCVSDALPFLYCHPARWACVTQVGSETRRIWSPRSSGASTWEVGVIRHPTSGASPTRYEVVLCLFPMHSCMVFTPYRLRRIAFSFYCHPARWACVTQVGSETRRIWSPRSSGASTWEVGVIRHPTSGASPTRYLWVVLCLFPMHNCMGFYTLCVSDALLFHSIVIPPDGSAPSRPGRRPAGTGTSCSRHEVSPSLSSVCASEMRYEVVFCLFPMHSCMGFYTLCVSDALPFLYCHPARWACVTQVGSETRRNWNLMLKA